MRQILDQEGPLTLARSSTAYEMLFYGHFLMSSECRSSERQLGTWARGRTLIGGMGMGFTLAEALGQPGVTSIDIVELSPAVIRWNRTVLAPLAGHPLTDARVRVWPADLADPLQGPAGPFDRILIDIDNGPSWTVRPPNRALYARAGIARLRRMLARTGLLAVWSAQPEPAFMARLQRSFGCVEAVAVPVTVGGRRGEDCIITATCETRKTPARARAATGRAASTRRP